MEFEPCRKCGGKEYYMTVDVRGVPEVRCKDCNCQITKTSSQNLYNYFIDQIQKIYDEQENTPKPEKPPCKYCTERWAILSGRMGVRPREMDDIKFCPMCGRELKPEDKQY